MIDRGKRVKRLVVRKISIQQKSIHQKSRKKSLKLFSFLGILESHRIDDACLCKLRNTFVTYAIWPHARHYVSLESNTFNFLWVMSKKHLFSRHFSHVVWLKESGSVARSRHFCPLLLCYFATYYNYLGLLYWARWWFTFRNLCLIFETDTKAKKHILAFIQLY